MRLQFLVMLSLGYGGAAEGSETFWEELPYFSAEDSPFYQGIQAETI